MYHNAVENSFIFVRDKLVGMILSISFNYLVYYRNFPCYPIDHNV